MECMNNQINFLSIGWKKKVLKSERFLREMNAVVPWEELAGEIRPHYKAAKTGRPSKGLERMFKIHCLQQWFGLSDPGMEEAIYDRGSFQRFLELDILGDDVPDETTILNFRRLLEKNGLSQKLFKRINGYLEDKGLMMKQGTIVDATLIAAPKSTRNESGKRDPEMSSTRKGNNWHFGMKANVGVDAQSGLVHSLKTTTASVHDKVAMEEVLHGEEKAVFGDKGYASDEDRKEARKNGLYWGVLHKAKRGHKLSASQHQQNGRMASIRAKVEHPFQVIKCQWRYVKARYRGIAKNTSQLLMLFALANLYKVRRKLLIPQTLST